MNTQTPKFVANRFQGAFILQMNEEMTECLFHLLDDFDDLKPHEFALRRKLYQLLHPVFNRNDEEAA